MLKSKQKYSMLNLDFPRMAFQKKVLNPTQGKDRKYFSYEKSSLVVQVILFDSSLVHRYIVSRTTHVQSYIVFFYKTKQS